MARDSSKNAAKLWENSTRLCDQTRALHEAIRRTIAESKIAVAEARQAIANIKNSRPSLHLLASTNPKNQKYKISPKRDLDGAGRSDEKGGAAGSMKRDEPFCRSGKLAVSFFAQGSISNDTSSQLWN